MKYRVILPYTETGPLKEIRRYEVDFEVEAMSSSDALMAAKYQFQRHLGEQDGAWSPHILEDEIKVEQLTRPESGVTKSLEQLLYMVRSSNADERLSAASGMSRFCEPEVKEALLELLDDPDERVVLAALSSLARIGDRTLIDKIAGLLRNSRNPKIVARAVSVLGVLGDERDAVIIEEVLKHEDDRVKANAIEALQNIGARNSLPAIYPFLYHSNNRVVANAAKALWKLAGMDVLSFCTRMLREKEKIMRLSAAFALGEIGHRPACEVLIEHLREEIDPDVIRMCLDSLGEIGDAYSIRFIKPYLRSDEPAIRKAAIRALDRIEQKRLSLIF